jgi:hypothetical protein
MTFNSQPPRSPHPIAPSSTLSPSFVTPRVPVVPASTNSFETMRIYPVFRTFEITGNSTEPARAPLFSLSNLRSASSSPARVVRHAEDLLLRCGPTLALPRTHLNLWPVTDWEWHASGSAARGTGVRKITNPHTLYKNGVSVRKGIEPIDTQCRPKAGCADHSNPHIRIFQAQEDIRLCPCRCLFSCFSSRRDLLLPLPLLVLLNQPQTLGCPILSPPDRAMVGERTPSTRSPLPSPRPLRPSPRSPRPSSKTPSLQRNPHPPNYFSPFYSAKSHVKPPNTTKTP